MRHHLRVSALILPVLLVVASANATSVNEAGDIKDTVKKSFAVEAGGTIAIDMDRGNVEIKSTRESMVYVEVERKVDVDSKEDAKRILDRHQLEMYKKGNDVIVRSRLEDTDRGWKRWRDGDQVKLRVVVRVPRKYNVDFTTGAGNVEADDIDGTVEGQTGAGNIEIGRVSGKVVVNSGSGNVSIDGAEGSVEVNTGAGNISVGEVAGEVSASSGAGNIEAVITRQPSSRSRLETGAGNVTVYLAKNVGIDVRAETGIGSADTDFGLKVDGNWMSKSFKGSVNGGGPSLTMSSGVGNVMLRSR